MELAVVADAPSAALAVVDDREVPASEVVALEDTPVELLAVDSTVAVELALEPDSAEVVLAGATDAANGVVTLLDARAEVEDERAATPAVEDGVNNALPLAGAAPDPAPEDDPAVFEAVPANELLVDDDWIYKSRSFPGSS